MLVPFAVSYVLIFGSDDNLSQDYGVSYGWTIVRMIAGGAGHRFRLLKDTPADVTRCVNPRFGHGRNDKLPEYSTLRVFCYDDFRHSQTQ